MIDYVPAETKIAGSFRDPGGFVFKKDGILYRSISRLSKDDYDRLLASGLYERLVSSDLLIRHEETNERLDCGSVYKIIRPEPIDFISYPYEWCFSQLKDAALLTLKIQRLSLDYGMSLKDSSCYNIQFKNGRPVFIDTLSFSAYSRRTPWVAYRQFCQHFLAPLALMSLRDVRLGQLLRVYIDGIPLDLASALLPANSRFAFGLFFHIHAHAGCQKYFAGKDIAVGKKKMGRQSILGLIDSLESAVGRLKWRARRSEWSGYYEDLRYSEHAFFRKKQLVADFCGRIKPETVWDIGANRGVFSRIAAEKGIKTISFDIDHLCVEAIYREAVKNKEANILPLFLDLANPSPGLGWQNKERAPLLERGPADCVFALAILHHLAIANNVPFKKIADLFRRICNFLIIEFIPPEEPMAASLLAAREGVSHVYTQKSFEESFKKYFTIEAHENIEGAQRSLYLMRKNSGL